MDVSDILAAQAAKQKAVTVEKEIPLEVDAGFLTVTDLNPIDTESYDEDVEGYLKATARDGVQALVSSLFSLPITSSPDGPLAKLPSPTTQLPRAKPLPKPKPPTKWEQFAKAKGIQKKRREKKEWDEEKQEWVDRWGWKGANKKEERQWITEVPANADADHDPAKASRDARKAKVAKNERQHQQNLARAQGPRASGTGTAPANSERKTQIDRTLATTRSSTASMGKFDKSLQGEKKLKGVKRKFDPTEVSATAEKSHNLAILQKLDREPAAKKVKFSGGDQVLNVRKAIRSVSKGKGSAALAREGGGGKAKKGRR
ncbi:ribosome biogenesis regulatory protein-domain-containing protein [Fomitopsis serialis]|uniref:ribosome biogenesis regulatory protein-domain-containing protein n=1 Tax=Fomitopsis serialis TaxID=139415 RepID=UPI0020074CA4|nr:ribosome biogenesis regulatory protein-domain-containing protein [Neoantrodia serialis]KAH9938030.1 ribosome biogenesis regulatory protein-domain-containing protein [Neoantrodia serialis]